MDLEALQTGLTTWFTEISGVPVEWQEEPYHIYTEPFAMLNIGPIVGIGKDGYEYEYTELTDTLTAYMIGVRQFTLQCRVRSFDQRQAMSARAALESARTKTRSTYSIEFLKALEPSALAIVSVQPLVINDYDHDGRRINQINMDIIFQLHLRDADESYGDSSIQAVDADGTYDPQELTGTVSVDTRE